MASGFPKEHSSGTLIIANRKVQFDIEKKPDSESIVFMMVMLKEGVVKLVLLVLLKMLNF